MKKRLTVVLLIMTLPVVFSFFMPASAVAEPIKLSYAQFAPAKTFVGVQLERWIAEVEKRTWQSEDRRFSRWHAAGG